MNKFLKIAGVLWVILVVFALVGCELDVAKPGGGGETNDSIVITGQTDRNISFYLSPNESATDPITLSVTAEKVGSGTLSYQWYKNTSASTTGGTAIDDADKNSYTVTETAAGEYYYYAVVTLTDGEKKSSISSSPITITIISTEDVADFANTITVDLGKKQYVRGFGGMSTPWDNAPDDNLNDFETMFNPEKLGYNISRIMIPPDNTDIDEMMRAFVNNETRFSGSYFSTNAGLPERNKDNSTYYNKVKIVNKYGGYVLASPWTPPADWKTNGSMVGGTNAKLIPGAYADFTTYLRRYCELMGEKGAPIYAVSLQNEFTYPDESYEGCYYTQTEHVDWWKQAGNYLDGVEGYGGGRQIPKVRAMSGEAHNEITALNSVLNDTAARGYIDLYGRHIYGASVTGGSFKNNAQDHPTDPVEIWMSEHNINSANNYIVDSTWNYVWLFMNDVDLTIRLNDENAFIWWTAKRFYSMIGDDTNGTTDGAVLPRGYGLSHFAKFAKESGRVGVTVTGSAAGVNPTTYSNTNTGAKISAFVTLTDDFYAKPVETRNARWKGIGEGAVPATLSMNDITAISLVMYTPTNTSGGSGTDMQTVKIELPDGFKIRSATAMRSNSSSPAPVYEAVRVGNDKKTAYVNMPASTILSVRFTK